jgi:hypothetical protein
MAVGITLLITDQTFGKQIVSTNVSAIPRKGDRIDMGYEPYSTVTDVIWKYETNGTAVTVVVK